MTSEYEPSTPGSSPPGTPSSTSSADEDVEYDESFTKQHRGASPSPSDRSNGLDNTGYTFPPLSLSALVAGDEGDAAAASLALGNPFIDIITQEAWQQLNQSADIEATLRDFIKVMQINNEEDVRYLVHSATTSFDSQRQIVDRYAEVAAKERINQLSKSTVNWAAYEQDIESLFASTPNTQQGAKASATTLCTTIETIAFLSSKMAEYAVRKGALTRLIEIGEHVLSAPEPTRTTMITDKPLGHKLGAAMVKVVTDTVKTIEGKREKGYLKRAGLAERAIMVIERWEEDVEIGVTAIRMRDLLR